MGATATLNLVTFVVLVFASLSRFRLTIETGGVRFSIVANVSGFGGFQHRFIDNAMFLPRPGRVNANRVAWLSDPSGSRSYDVAGWGSEIVFPFLSDL